MDKCNFKYLKEDDHPLKIDKDLIQIQKTIIFYGEKILLELNKLEVLIKTNNQNKEINHSGNNKDQLINQLLNLKIPKGYGKG